ncbi:MAG: lipoyl synthase [Elusimicrobia bacterium]|nr:lipoyl synthase [Elusimicrobiota bacterium]
MKNFPPWLDRKIELASLREVSSLLSGLRLHTICEEARCPNISECFSRRRATFLILGDICTRNCGFCSVKKGIPRGVDKSEPRRVAEASARLGLKFVVLTSPTRDDLPDGGAELFLESVREIKRVVSGIKVEILVPDFLGNIAAIEKISTAGASVVAHNLETVRRLYDIRRGADYDRSLMLLGRIKEFNPDVLTKSGIMVGLGETDDEVRELFADLIRAGCDFLSIGQYLQPSKKCRPVAEFVRPEKFEKYRETALAMGFKHVESAPYVRSSFRAEEYLEHRSAPV